MVGYKAQSLRLSFRSGVEERLCLDFSKIAYIGRQGITARNSFNETGKWEGCERVDFFFAGSVRFIDVKR